MPASLYRLAGRPHHAEVPTVPVAEQVAAEPVVSPVEHAPPVSVIEEPAPEVLNVESPAHDDTAGINVSLDETAASPDVTSDESATTTSTVTWDPAWTKAQLLEVALQLNLNVSSANTKNQIIDALTAATST